MKRLVRLLSIGAAFALLGSSLLPSLAQETNPEAGQGGTVVAANLGDDPSTFNPVIGNDTASSDVYDWLYPDIIEADPKTLEDTPSVAGGLAESWEYDDSGTKLTVKLRQDLTWSDGTPITADDYLWAFNAVKTGQTSSPRTYVFYELDDGTVTDGSIFDAKKIDDYTIEFTMGVAVKDADGKFTGEIKPSCTALNDINDIAVAPSHVYGPKFDSDLSGMDSDPYFVGPTWGPFKDPYLEFGVQTSLLADTAYPDAVLGYVSPGEWIYRQVENTNVMYERFLAGDFSYITVAPNKQNEFRDLAAEKGYQVIEYPSNGYTYMGYNLADPQNPQPGRDENGNIVDQGQHPIFGDKLVRQAIAHGVDVLAMIGTRPEGDKPGTGILQGNGYPLAVHNHPGLSWVDPGLEPYAFDQAQAKELLAEAGWSDEDGDGFLECHGCKYAKEVDPSFEGQPLKFTLLTNAGNVNREATGETIKTQLAEIGIQVDFQAIEFGALVDAFVGQQYDAIIIGWNLGLPFDPDSSAFFGIGADIPGSGFNTSSYSNQEYEKLLEEGKSLPGCDRAARAEIYKKTLQMLYDDQPYLWLYATTTMIAAQPNVKNWDPLPYASTWNLDAWTVSDN
jgi:peptide/nickel transport system substrate-binding protein